MATAAAAAAVWPRALARACRLHTSATRAAAAPGTVAAHLHDLVSNGSPSFEVTNPATGDVVASIPDHSLEDTRRAIKAAHAAGPAWAAVPAKQKAEIMLRWYKLLVDHTDYLGWLMTTEQGKPLAEAKGEVAYGSSFVSWFAAEALRVYGMTIPSPGQDQRILVMKQPVGVAACITPWNFPLAMLTRKAAAAFAAGCTVVAKPAADTPLTAQACVALAIEAGIPKDAFQLVTCSHERVAEIGNELAKNPLVRKISFTGSTGVGKHLTELAASTMKRVSMELGGNAPFIVFEDADLDKAVAGLMASKFRNSGQTCVCTNRVFVHEAVHDAFVSKLKAAIEKLKVGNGLSEGVNQGPLIHERAVKKVESLLDDAVSKGAKVAAGGKRHSLGGTFFEPTLVLGIEDSMEISQAEIFGPVATVKKFSSTQQAVEEANKTDVGLAGYFYTKDLARAWRVAEALQVGMVGVNAGIISSEVAPFGGVKDSGVGREGSKFGIEEYLDIKYVMMNLDN